MIYKNGVYIPPLDDTPVDAETEEGITSNWAYDHKADIDAHISGATAGQLLVATGATTAVLKSTGVVLSAPDISGSVSAASALTMPTFAMSGALNMNSQYISNPPVIQGLAATGMIILSRGYSNILSLRSQRYSADPGEAFNIQTFNASNVQTSRLAITGGIATAVATWALVTHTGLVLSGALDANSQDINNVAAPGAAGDPLIKGTRVTTAELPTLTENKIWAGNGSNVPVEIDPGVDWSAKTPVVGDALQAAGSLAAETYYDAISVTAAGYLTSSMWRYNAGDTAPGTLIYETLKVDAGEIFRSADNIDDGPYFTGYDGTNEICEMAFTLLHRFDTSFKIGCCNKSLAAAEKGVRLVSCAYVLD